MDVGFDQINWTYVAGELAPRIPALPVAGREYVRFGVAHLDGVGRDVLPTEDRVVAPTGYGTDGIEFKGTAHPDCHPRHDPQPGPDVPDGHHATQPFFELYVKNDIQGGSLVIWGLKRTFFDPGPYTFKLQWAETPNGEWEDVETGPLVDTYYVVDHSKRVYALEAESYYRVVLTTSKGVYVSMAVQSNGIWSKRDWLIARDICRKELLYAKKFVGMNVGLIKRRIWGPRCQICADWDSKEVARSLCYSCWGTGIVGGYWPPYMTWTVDPKGGLVRFKETNEQMGKGTDENIEMVVRVLGYPHLSTYDLLKDSTSTGRIFVVREVSEEVNVRGVPIIYSAKIKMLPFSHFLYQWPNLPPVPPEPEYAPVLRPAEEWMY